MKWSSDMMHSKALNTWGFVVDDLIEIRESNAQWSMERCSIIIRTQNSAVII